MHADELRRASPKDLLEGKRWDLDGVYEVERHFIEAWVRARAREAASSKDATLTSALAVAGVRAATIAALFGRRDEYRDAALLEKAGLLVLQREAPSRSTVITLTILTLFSALLEIAIFVAIWLARQGTATVIASGAFLAGGGLLIGLGVGRLVGFQDEQGTRIQRTSWLEYGSVVLGAVAILMIALLRGSGQESNAWLVAAVTITIALLVALFEALSLIERDKRNDMLTKMFKCQVWRATERHIKDCEKGSWQIAFEAEVRQLFGAADAVLKGMPTPIRRVGPEPEA